MGLSFEEQMELQDQIVTDFSAIEQTDDFERQLSLQDQIVAALGKLLGTATQIAKTLYERLVAGEFLNESSDKFKTIIENVYGEVQDLSKIVSPTLIYLEKHRGELNTLENKKEGGDGILESAQNTHNRRILNDDLSYEERRELRKVFGPVRIKDKGVEYGGARDIVIDIDTRVDSPENYREIIRAIEDAREADTIVLKINTPGGDTDSAHAIYVALLESRAKTIARILNAYSAGSMIAMSCDEVQTTPHCSMMIHGASGFQYGKISEMQAQAKFFEQHFHGFFDELYAGFLSADEITDMLKGQDFWLSEDDIKNRLKNWKPIRIRRKAEAQANNAVL